MAIVSNKPSKWDKVVKWYASHAYAVNIIYSAGASVVIIGALFKILHWPGASQVLMVGMFTEAFLFILGIFEKPHAAYHWEHVFPQLVEEGAKPIEGGLGKENDLNTVQGLTEEDVKSLQEGIAKVAKTANQLASIGDVATATSGLMDNMAAAGKAAQSFAAANEILLDSADGVVKQYQVIQGEMAEVANQTKSYGKGVQGINNQLVALNGQLVSLNSVYELQMKEIQTQTAIYAAQTQKVNSVNETMNAVAGQVAQLQKSTSEAVEAGKKYVAAQQKLAEQVADLNKVYGNMLSAL